MTIQTRFTLLMAATLLGLSTVFTLLYLTLNQLQSFSQLEAALAQSRSKLLSLKQQEQAFIYHNQPQAAEQLILGSEQLEQQLQGFSQRFQQRNLKTEPLQQALDANRRYRERFQQLQQVKTELGLSPTTGMYGRLRRAVHRVEERLKQLNSVHLTASMLMLRRHEKDFMLRGNDSYLQRFEQQIGLFDRSLSAENFSAQTEQAIRQDMQLYRETFQAFALSSKTVGLDQHSGAIGALNRASEDASRQLARTLEQSHQQIARRIADNKRNSLLLAALFLLLLLSSLYWLSRRVVSRIGHLVSHLNQIADGNSDLSVRLHSQSKDELGQMANAFNRFVAKIAASMQTAIHAGRQLDDNAAELRRSAESTLQVAAEQQQLLQQLNHALNETGAGSHQVQQQIGQAQQTMQQVSDKTHAINQLAKDNRQATRALINEVSQTSSHIEALNQDSQTINDVMHSISEIAAQTNLLALNAAIEAARAGEQGRGFAVVADEVRALAGKTQQSTEQIQSQVSNLQHNTGQASTSIQATRQTTDEQLNHSARISEVFAVIEQDFDSLKHQNNEVEQLSHQQLGRISAAEDQLQQVLLQIEQNLAAAEQTRSASDQLFRLSRNLQKTLGQFAGGA